MQPPQQQTTQLQLNHRKHKVQAATERVLNRKGILKARLRDEYHAGIGCRAVLFLTDEEMAEAPAEHQLASELQRSNSDSENDLTELNALEPTSSDACCTFFRY